MFFENLAYAMAPQANGGGAAQGNPIMAFMPLIILFVIFYFLLIRPQQKKAKEHKEMLGNLKKGDRVITGGGLYGRIVAASEEVLTLEVADNVHVKINRNYVSTLVEAKGAAKEVDKSGGKKPAKGKTQPEQSEDEKANQSSEE
ncbi:MAG: preprotein translocase subunit YajC [Desulfohalobium sp.]